MTHSPLRLSNLQTALACPPATRTEVQAVNIHRLFDAVIAHGVKESDIPTLLAAKRGVQ